MQEEHPSTLHAPAARLSPPALDRQTDEFQQATLLHTIADAIPTILVILNKQRQIVYTNKRLLELSGTGAWEHIKGKRPGEVLDCIHASESPGGCGTTEFCQTCGAVNAILDSQQGIQSVQECRIRNKAEEALELRVWATPYEHNSELFTIFAALDVSNEKRRQMLERIFFHDVLNVAGNISGLSQLLQVEEDPQETTAMTRMLHHTSKLLIEEIQMQRQLSESERGDLEVSFAETSAMALLRNVAETYAEHEAVADRFVVIAETSEDCLLRTDPVILRRVLGNMVKNALEATSPGGTVVLTCSTQADTVEFSIHNESHMTREVQLQLFQRSFSTKGTGRGLGTYSMKLLGEKYLGGTVEFKSSKEDGTTFYLRLPQSHEALL